MKKAGMILMLAILVSLSAFAGKKKQQDNQDNAGGVDWLNAPTPDGSPTLKQTSDWLAKTLQAYGGEDRQSGRSVIREVRIDNSCNFHYSVNETGYSGNPYVRGFDVTLPLGAVHDIYAWISDIDAPPVGIDISTGQTASVQFSSHSRRETSTSANSVVWIAVRHVPEPILGGEAPEAAAQMIPRIITALQHAVDLCRSTYKPPAESKEPF
jgi:hypothetical protein